MGQKTVFTHLAITLLKVNQFGWNLEPCEPIVGPMFGAGPGRFWARSEQ